MNTSQSKKTKHLSVSYSFTKTSSFSQYPPITIKKRRHTSSYKELYLNKQNYLSTPTTTSNPKPLDMLYATIYKSNTSKILHNLHSNSSNLNKNFFSNITTNRHSSNTNVQHKLKEFKKEIMNINKFNTNSNNIIRNKYNYSSNNLKSIIYKRNGDINNGAKRLLKGSDKKEQGEMILTVLGVDKSFERKMNEGSKNGDIDGMKGEDEVNEDDTNFLVTDRQEKSVLKGTLVDNNEKGDFEDMNEIKNQLDNAIARSVKNKKGFEVTNGKEVEIEINDKKEKWEHNINDNENNEIDKQNEITIISQNDMNSNNNCNIIFKSDSFNYSNNINYNNTNNNDNDTNIVNIQSTDIQKQVINSNIISNEHNNIHINSYNTSSLEEVSSFPFNFQKNAKSNPSKQLHEIRYSNEDNEPEHLCDNKGKEYCNDEQEIKEEDEEYEESIAGSILKNVKKRKSNGKRNDSNGKKCGLDCKWNTGDDVNDIIDNRRSNKERNVVMDEIELQKKKLLDIKHNKIYTNISSDFERLQKIKTLLYKTSPQSNIPNEFPFSLSQHSTTKTSYQSEFSSSTKNPKLSSPFTITNISLTINNNIFNSNPNPTSQPLNPPVLTLSKQQTFNILPTPIYSPNNIQTNTNIPSSPPVDINTEIDTFLSNLKLRNKSKESHLTSLKLQKQQELLQLKSKQQYYAKQKQESQFHKSSNIPNCTYKENNVLTYINNIINENTNAVRIKEIKFYKEEQCFKKNTYTSIVSSLLEDERYNTLRNNIKKKGGKEKYEEMFKKEGEKEKEVYLNKVKEDIRGIERKRRVKEELNGFVCGGNGNGGGKNIARCGIGKRNDCVMPVNSIDGVVDAHELGFFTNYYIGINGQKGNTNNNQGVLGINTFNNYTFKK